MIKKYLLVLLLVFVLAACGAPAPEVIRETAEPVEPIKETVEVPVEVPGEPYPVTATAPAPTEVVEYGVLFLLAEQNTRLWRGLENANGEMIFERYEPELRYNAGDIIVAYNGKGELEYFLNEDGSLPLAEASFPNAQEFDNDGIPEFPGRWCGKWVDVEGNLRSDEKCFYKVAGLALFVQEVHVSIPECENIDLINAPAGSCQQ